MSKTSFGRRTPLVPKTGRQDRPGKAGQRKNTPRPAPDDTRRAAPDDTRRAAPDDTRRAAPDDPRRAAPDDTRRAVPDDTLDSVLGRWRRR